MIGNETIVYAIITLICQTRFPWDLGTWAAPRILRWGGVQNRIRERNERKKILYPPLFQMWSTSKQISVGAYWIYWNLLLSRCRI